MLHDSCLGVNVDYVWIQSAHLDQEILSQNVLKLLV
jgi:hypothetical protein